MNSTGKPAQLAHYYSGIKLPGNAYYCSILLDWNLSQHSLDACMPEPLPYRHTLPEIVVICHEFKQLSAMRKPVSY